MNKDHELQMLNSQAHFMTDQLDRVESSLLEVEYIKSSLDELSKGKEGTEMLAPVSNGIFFKVKSDKNNRLLVNVGNNVVVEKSIEETKKMLDERSLDMMKLRDELFEQLQKIEDRLIELGEE